ncbi:MAG: DUF4383 domain-containing protein [Actinomycetota bacterium]|nr:DUF4383 domain-containing protein [Actinomycetota bacterium]
MIFGLAYVAVALLELILDELTIGGAVILDRTVLQNVVHWVIAIAVLGSFFAGENAARMVARIVGIVLVVLAIWGFVDSDSLGNLLGYEEDGIPAAYNWVHLVTGLAALFAGFFATRAYASRPAAA